MLLDNKNNPPAGEKFKIVYNWFTEYLVKDAQVKGDLNIVTGYFTVSALNRLVNDTNTKINKYRFVLGDIVSKASNNEQALNLLNEELDIEKVFFISQTAKNVIKFLEQKSVEVKTLEADFCHAKLYIFKEEEGDNHQKNFYITGSSNLTDSGLGLKPSANVELNIANFGSVEEYEKLCLWFDNLWESSQAHTHKSIIDEKGKEKTVDFKEFLITEISKIFFPYTPKDIYYKILFELYGKELLKTQEDEDLSKKIVRLEKTKIFSKLYPFQKEAAKNLIHTLKTYNGAILADAVGLGKTWTALAVMKYYQQQGTEVILICPKKLEQNWTKFLPKMHSQFEEDKFDYIVRAHTDMRDGALYGNIDQKNFEGDKPKLIVIDESHNFRNDKSARYKFLVAELLKKNEDVKVLLLSATPINNSLNDIRNQFWLLTRQENNGFDESLGVKNIFQTFKTAQAKFNEWKTNDNKNVTSFVSALNDTDFFRLTDTLVLARNRKMIKDLKFPDKATPMNEYIAPVENEQYADLEKIIKDIESIKLVVYQPNAYLLQDVNVSVLNDQKKREFYLATMMQMLMVKRLESSWWAFFQTLQKMRVYSQATFEKIEAYQKHQQQNSIDEEQVESIFEDDEKDLSIYTIGKKNPVNLSDIDKNGTLDIFKDHLEKDLENFKKLIDNLEKLDEIVNEETGRNSKDKKLDFLIKTIKEKQNKDNKKIIIFTAYKDTASYLFKELKKRGFAKLAVVTGSTKEVTENINTKLELENILERFAPYTKLMKEKEWDKFNLDKTQTIPEQFKAWKDFIKAGAQANQSIMRDAQQQLDSPIDILIATDVLSEGQNLQDADMVVNYDIHWNPVRLIQRIGRVDRIGSPNDTIKVLNIWPAENINEYLKLQSRIEDKMVAMLMGGTDIQTDFTKELKEKLKDNEFEKSQTDKMLKRMEGKEIDDIETSDESLGFDSLSTQEFRLDLQAELDKEKTRLRQMPQGVFSGFLQKNTTHTHGIVALMGYPRKNTNEQNYQYQSHELIFIDEKGENILSGEKIILDFLALHKDNVRSVPAGIEEGNKNDIDKWIKALKSFFLNRQTPEKQEIERSIFISGLAQGNFKQVQGAQSKTTFDEINDFKRYDLLAWMLVS